MSVPVVVRSVAPSHVSSRSRSSFREGPHRTTNDVIEKIHEAETRSVRPPSHAGSLVRVDPRSIEDINAEIAALELEARAKKWEHKAEIERDRAHDIRERPVNDYELVEERRSYRRSIDDDYYRRSIDEYDYRRPRTNRELVLFDRSRSLPRGEYVVYERPKSPPRNIIRVEKDRRGRMALVRSAR